MKTKYFLVYDRPMKLITPAGQNTITVLELNRKTGKFENNMTYFAKIMLGRDDVEKLTEESFIQEVEKIRGRNMKGEGTLYDLYEVINGLEDVAQEEGRKLTPNEKAIIVGLRKKTYKLFEAMIEEVL